MTLGESIKCLAWCVGHNKGATLNYPFLREWVFTFFSQAAVISVYCRMKLNLQRLYFLLPSLDPAVFIYSFVNPSSKGGFTKVTRQDLGPESGHIYINGLIWSSSVAAGLRSVISMFDTRADPCRLGCNSYGASALSQL